MDNQKCSKEYDVAIKVVNNIFSEYQLTEIEQEHFLTDTITIIRLSRIINIYKILRTMFSSERSVIWLRAQNDFYDGKSAIDIISESAEGLKDVQNLLKYQIQEEELELPIFD